MNKWRRLNPVTVAQTKQIARNPFDMEGTMYGGLWVDKSSQQIELTQSPDLDRVRVERKGLRQDFGSDLLGTPAPSTILAQGEHRFVRAGTIFEKKFRLYKDGSNFAVIQSWDGATWNTEVTSAFTISDVFLSWESRFNRVYFAPITNGPVFVWDQSDLQQNEGDDFPAANLIGGYGASITSATVNPAGATGNAYRAHFSFRMRGINVQEGGSATIQVLYSGQVLGQKTIALPVNIDSSSFDYTLANQTIDFIYPLPNNAVVSLFVSGISSFPFVDARQAFTVAASNIQLDLTYVLFKSVGNQYDVNFILDQKAADTQTMVRIAVDYGSGFVTLYEGQHGNGAHTVSVTVTNRPTAFRVTLPEESDDTNWEFQDTPDANTIIRDETVLIEVHGYRTADDGTAGISYNTNGSPVNTLTQVYKDAPANTILLTGSFVTNFADRLLVLQNDGDEQKIIFCVNDDPDDWQGIGSGELVLSSRSDPVDNLMAFKPMTANVGALFRRQSIMRVVQTGQILNPLAFYSWIEELGTESPFSVVIVPGGLIFLGNDRQVHILNEGGPQQIGGPIWEKFLQFLGDVFLVEAVYHPVTQEYILTIPPEV